MALEPVRVVVRIRPLNDRERSLSYATSLQCVDKQRVRIILNGEDQSVHKQFALDRIFDAFCDQETIFRESGMQRMVEYALEGFSSTVFAYGQTGSGKTFTMSGDESQFINGLYNPSSMDGIIPRSLSYLTAQIESMRSTTPNTTYSLQASFLEIYNEIPRDLLAHQKASQANLQVRWAADGGFFIENQIVVECRSPDDLMAVFSQGHRNRHVAGHELNMDSSRSHCILSVMIIAITTEKRNGNSRTTVGKISFVDLAGSERLRDTKSSGDLMLKETSSINRSLFLLGKVISALGSKPSDTGVLGQHIPYRDSLLTKLLMDSLGGAGKTLMIACVSPAIQHIKETMSTLSYSYRTRRIQNRPVKRTGSSEQSRPNAAMIALETHAIHLEKEVGRLKELLSFHGIGCDGFADDSKAFASSRQTNANNAITAALVPTKPYEPRRRPGTTTNQLPPITITSPTCSQTSPLTSTISHQIQGLLQENVTLQNARLEQERRCKQALEENERLTEKVRNLEKIFIEDNFGTPRPDTQANLSPMLHSGHEFDSVEYKELLTLRRSNLKLRAELDKRDRLFNNIKHKNRNE